MSAYAQYHDYLGDYFREKVSGLIVLELDRMIESANQRSQTMEVKLACRTLAVAGVRLRNTRKRDRDPLRLIASFCPGWRRGIAAFALLSGLAHGALIPATVAELAKGDPTISSPVTFNATAFMLNVPNPPIGFEITLAQAQISFGDPVTPMTVYLTNGQLSTANLPFYNGCLSIPPTGSQTQATCIGEGWQVGPANVAGNQLMATFSFSSPQDAMTAQTWANNGTLFVAFGGNVADQLATCSPCTGPISNGITVALITADSSVPEPGTIGFVAVGTAAIIALRRRRAPRG